MRVIKTTLFILFTCLALTSCDNEPLEGTFTDEIGTGGGGGQAGTGTSTGEYFPRAIGNTWTYSVNTGGTHTNTMNATSTINSFTYYDMPSENGFGSIRKTAASYFSRVIVDLSTPAYNIVGTPIEIKFLQDDATPGTSWENQSTVTYTYTPIGGSPAIPDAVVNVNYRYTLEESGISRDVNGQTYNDVIRVSLIYETGLGPDVIGNYYFAKDVGPIEYSIDATVYKLNNYTLN